MGATVSNQLRLAIMRWRSGSSHGSSNDRQPASLTEQLQQNEFDVASSEALPRIDDDEQDYSFHDHPRYDDDNDDPHRCGSAVGEPSIAGLPPSASHHHDDDLGGISQSQRQQHQQPSSSTAGLMSTLAPSDDRAELPPLTSSVGSAISGSSMSATAAVVIEDDDDDPGLDHALPPDECSDSLSPVTAWMAQSQQSTCEFTHTITHYSQKRESGCKKAEYSATTVDTYGNRWRLIVYVNGNGRASNHHLSLFLQVADADELPFGWKKAVSYVLTLEHPSGTSLGYAKRNPDKTFKLCPKAIDWGWSQFITSDRIQQEGYVSNDSLTVRASVTVKSSSVSIDAEDAELYLKCAVEEGDANAVNACLRQGAGVNCQFKDDLYTPLHTACSSSTSTGSLEVLKLLLKRGADGNACNKWRETPLLIAANNGHRAAVEALLESGADPSLCSEAGWSALTFAAHKGYDDIVSLLLAAGAPVNCRVTEDLSTPLHKACAGGKPGHLSAVKQLLDGGADVHALNKWRETPLLTAANHGQAAAVEALLQAGGDPCKCTDTGWSPLSIAAYKGHDDVVRLLLEEGAPTEEADPTLSALLQAATKGLPDTVELLLRNGADHTVTTKKGDTALSILVEQNLIDAAVEMVTEYKASVPRCSRDRKKVQRARLLINLRVKQQQRDGILNGDVETTDDESEQDEVDSDSNSALHDADGSPSAAAPLSSKKKKKKFKSRASAEAEARAAEEALLLELEEEDAKAQKDEAAATSKRAKKRKKRERERQQRLKEEKAQREKNERAAREREMQQRAKEEKERKEREKKERDDKEREIKQAEEREKEAAAKRREKEERDKRQREQAKKDRERSERLERKANQAHASQLAARAVSPAIDKKSRGVSKAKPQKKQQQIEMPKADDITSVRASSTKSSTANAPAAKSLSQKKRGWETKTASTSSISVAKKSQAPAEPLKSTHAQPAREARVSPPLPVTAANKVETAVESSEEPKPPPPPFSVEDQLENMANGVVDFLGFDSPPNNVRGTVQQAIPNQSAATGPSDANVNVNAPPAAPLQHEGAPFQSNIGRIDDAANQFSAVTVELPSVAIFQQEKVSELLQRCNIARSSPPTSQPDPLSMVNERTIKTAVYRWMVRASHGTSQFLDPVIPSWTDADMLAEFLQRQFISESRRGVGQNSNSGIISIEILKEAGSAMAMLCFNLAKDLTQFRMKCEQQVPHDWSDAAVNITASEIMRNDGSSCVVVDWAGRSQVYIPSQAFAVLRDRFRGPPNRLLTAVFAAAKRYEARRMIVAGTSLDYRLSPSTRECLSRTIAMSFELWTDPLTVSGNNAFCGMFPDIDIAFAGLPPFGKEDGGGELALLQHGGSVAVLPPLESSTASLYLRNMIDLLERSESNAIPLSFAVFLPTECFRELNHPPSPSDVSSLDPRLGEMHRMYIRCLEPLPAGQHTYHCGDGDGISDICQTGSLFLILQNEAGTAHFPLSESSIVNILRSASANFVPVNELPLPVPAHVGYHEAAHDNATVQSPGGMVNGPDMGGLGGAMVANNFSCDPRRPGRRGRLFELVDDGEDENGNDVDVVSGMLNNLNVSMFQNNPSQDVDIEAISLMGIGGAPLGNRAPGGSGRFG